MFTFQRLHHWPQPHPFPYLYSSPDDGNENDYFVHYKLYMGSDCNNNNSIASARKVTEYVSSHINCVPLRALSVPITLSWMFLDLHDVWWRGRGGWCHAVTFCWWSGGRRFSSVLATTDCVSQIILRALYSTSTQYVVWSVVRWSWWLAQVVMYVGWLLVGLVFGGRHGWETEGLVSAENEILLAIKNFHSFDSRFKWDWVGCRHGSVVVRLND